MSGQTLIVPTVVGCPFPFCQKVSIIDLNSGRIASSCDTCTRIFSAYRRLSNSKQGLLSISIHSSSALHVNRCHSWQESGFQVCGGCSKALQRQTFRSCCVRKPQAARHPDGLQPAQHGSWHKLSVDEACCWRRSWLAYPHFAPPERFQPFKLTEGLYLNNAWENAASAMEMSAVAAKNCALLIARHLSQADACEA